MLKLPLKQSKSGTNELELQSNLEMTGKEREDNICIEASILSCTLRRRPNLLDFQLCY